MLHHITWPAEMHGRNRG